MSERKVSNALLENPTQCIFIAGGDLNPLPTALTDIPSSTRVFSLSEPKSLMITYGCRFQMNSSMSVGS